MSDFLVKASHQIKVHEGFSAVMKEDLHGYQIGFGHNLVRPISPHAATVIFQDDLGIALNDLDHNQPFWRSLPEEAQLILLNMAYNLGWPRLKGFKRMWAALEKRDYFEAAAQMRDSKWFGQVKSRGIELADRMEALSKASTIS